MQLPDCLPIGINCCFELHQVLQGHRRSHGQVQRPPRDRSASIGPHAQLLRLPLRGFEYPRSGLHLGTSRLRGSCCSDRQRARGPSTRGQVDHVSKFWRFHHFVFKVFTDFVFWFLIIWIWFWFVKNKQPIDPWQFDAVDDQGWWRMLPARATRLWRR